MRIALGGQTNSHNWQETDARVTLMTGEDPTLRGDANRTLGVGGAPNPFAGRLYLDGTWRRDVHSGDVRETRVAISYQIDTRSRIFGRHRLAAMASRNAQFDVRANSWLALAGRLETMLPLLAVVAAVNALGLALWFVGIFIAFPITLMATTNPVRLDRAL